MSCDQKQHFYNTFCKKYGVYVIHYYGYDTDYLLYGYQPLIGTWGSQWGAHYRPD